MDKETDAERYKDLKGQYEEKRQWLPGGTYRQLSNALLAAAGGNIGGAASEFAQRAVVSYLQQEGASKIGDLVAKRLIKEGSAEHVAWQAIIGCVGAAGSGDACGAGALGAGASVIVNSLISDVSGLSDKEKETRRNIVSALIVGAASVLDLAAAAALNNAAVAEMENNLLNPHRDHDLVALLARQDELSPEQESALFERLKQAHATGTQEALEQMESVMGPAALNETRQALVNLLEDGSACAVVPRCNLQLERSVEEIDRLLEAYETQRVLTPKLEGALIIAELAGGVGGLALKARNAVLMSAKRKGGDSLDSFLIRQSVIESSLPPLRQAYVNEVSALEGIGLSLRAAGGDVEQIARALHAERRAIGVKYKILPLRKNWKKYPKET
ncbi:hemagglutinin-like secreted protein [plant metagenome]